MVEGDGVNQDEAHSITIMKLGNMYQKPIE